VRKLSTHLVGKVWGRSVPPAPFANPLEEPLGEIWFDPPPEVAGLLVKFIFTDAALSVQVHPDDAHAPPGHRGKNECWYILDAKPGATIAVGLKRAMAEEDLRSAALDGSIEQELRQIEVTPGDCFSIPAGTVHAIGAGISLLEVQQNSDITYRLYDYGRPRELHQEEGLRVAQRTTYDTALQSRADGSGYSELVDGEHFRFALLSGESLVPKSKFAGNVLLLPLSGTVTLHGELLEIGSCTQTESVSGIRVNEGGRVAIVEQIE
tara:strand:- start:7434 stop:8228 length:795 start_codon:yes stop_codon:yes gene_type:complete